MAQFYQIVSTVLALATTAHAVIMGHATCDKRMVLYADGIQKAQSSTWQTAATVILPDNTHVVAIECTSRESVGGIRAAFDNGVSTDGSWKCSNTYTPGWNEERFDDSGWAAATRVSPWVVSNYWNPKPLVLRNNGSWIWTTGYLGQQRVTFCRTHFPKKDCHCDHTVVIREHVQCDCTLQEEVKQLREDMTKQFTDVRNFLATTLEKVMEANSAAHPDVLNKLNQLQSTMNRCCYSRPPPAPISRPAPCTDCPPGPPGIPGVQGPPGPPGPPRPSSRVAPPSRPPPGGPVP